MDAQPRDAPSRDDPVLARFSAAVRATYGDRLDRIVLFGSRARGDHRADSDYDVAVFIEGTEGVAKELDRLTAITAEILSETGAYISPKPFDTSQASHRTRLMRAIREEGQVVAGR